MTKTLYIFDFDGTIFKSPEPNPSIWTSMAMGRIKSMPEEGSGFGWFQETITLDHPYVPSPLEDDSWFNKNVVKDALDAYKDTNNIVCLLTGRTELYAHLIDRICQSANLEFHHKGLKPINIPNVVRESTFEFKKRFILDLVHTQYKDQISNIIVYEDRLPHVELFNGFLGTIKTLKEFKVVHVNEEPKYLNHHDELALVDHLVTKNSNPKAELKKTVDYTGLVLDKESVDKILSLVEIPSGWFLKAHHITLNLGPINTKLWKPITSEASTSAAVPTTAVDKNESEIIEKISNLSIETKEETTTSSTTTTVTVSSSTTTSVTTKSTEQQSNQFDTYTVGSEWVAEIEAIGFSSNALAVKVKGVPTANTIPHCTVAIHPSAKASDSNQIRNWYPIDTLKLGEKIQLSSVDQNELSVYKDLIEKQDLLKTDSPTKGNGKSNPHSKKAVSVTPIAPSLCHVSLPSNLKEDSKKLILKGTITEVGKLSYEIYKAPKKEKIIPYPIIQRVIPSYSKAEILKIVPKVSEWLEKSGTTDIKLIEEYISTNFNDFK